MTTNEPTKLGGPYTKSEQEIRRDSVYEMYFEKAMPAIKIADKLGVNRNTINSDIKYWMTEIGAGFGKKNKENAILLQIQYMLAQYSRLVKELDGLDFEPKYKAEKLIFEITYKLACFISKLSVGESNNSEITPEMISGIIKQLCHSELIEFHDDARLSDIKKALMRITLDSPISGNDFLSAIMNSGLDLYKHHDRMNLIPVQDSYDLLEFALARKVISNNEKAEILKKDRKTMNN